eukprot:TRINITY_DN38804_c0_g1_i1.p1 TRINITY_DN38804_c0_g1~~TRINITY_DN38804_c0_g1_i1.p1  ORF type:complete len:163 (-),score=21.88 TRINITY_DN38804_c0_g1_i1:163-651(-)
MVLFECRSCGYSCGTQEAWTRQIQQTPRNFACWQRGHHILLQQIEQEEERRRGHLILPQQIEQEEARQHDHHILPQQIEQEEERQHGHHILLQQTEQTEQNMCLDDLMFRVGWLADINEHVHALKRLLATPVNIISVVCKQEVEKKIRRCCPESSDVQSSDM